MKKIGSSEFLIRQAEKRDIHTICRLLASYQGNNHFGTPVCTEYTSGLLEILIDGSVVIVAELDSKIEGVLVTVVAPCIVDAQMLQASVLCFWVNRDLESGTIVFVGGELLNEGKAQLVKLGAEMMLLSTNEKSIPELELVCRQAGLAPVGMVWRNGIKKPKDQLAS